MNPFENILLLVSTLIWAVASQSTAKKRSHFGRSLREALATGIAKCHFTNGPQMTGGSLTAAPLGTFLGETLPAIRSRSLAPPRTTAG